jgi:mono/diheme cytochrome c family protein
LALTGYDIALATVALIFVAFALIVSLVIPRSRPDFPGGRLGVFIGICVVLFMAQMGAVLALAELGEAEEPVAEEAAPPTETGPTETAPTETAPTETAPTEPVDTETAPPETPTETETSTAAGKEVFLAQCGSCHTFADAGTTGSVGPNLDAAKPPVDLVVERVTNGQGIMPSFSDTLSEQQIADVAAYVAAVAGS